MKKIRSASIFLIALLALLSQETFACPVCYGLSDSPMSEGVNAAILVLMVITGTVLSTFVAFFLYLRKRSKITLGGSVDFPNMN